MSSDQKASPKADTIDEVIINTPMADEVVEFLEDQKAEDRSEKDKFEPVPESLLR